MARKRCSIEDGILCPCEAMDQALQGEGHGKGINYFQIRNFENGQISTRLVAVIHSGRLPKGGAVANYCPFCGEPIAHHVVPAKT